MPSESEPVYVEPAPEAQLDSSKVWLCKKAFQGLKITPQAWGFHSTQKINDMRYNQLISDSSTFVKKCAQRSEDSILLHHMDDVVGTVPEEHLMSDFEHMKTSLYLTDVVVLRNEGDTGNFWGLEITKTSRGFEVKSSTDLVASFVNLYGLENSKPTANPGRRSTAMELASAIPLDGHKYSNFRTAVGKLIFMPPLETRHAIRHPKTIHTSPQSNNREQARSETVGISKARNTLVFVLNRAEWFKKVCWNSLVVVPQIWPAIQQRAKALRDIIATYKESTMCNRSL